VRLDQWFHLSQILTQRGFCIACALSRHCPALLTCIHKKVFPVVMAEGPHLFPFRTQKLSPPTAMVLRGQLRGRVARCRGFFLRAPKNRSPRFFSPATSPAMYCLPLLGDRKCSSCRRAAICHRLRGARSCNLPEVTAGSYLFLYLTTYAIGVQILLAYGYSFRESLFEFASALGTVGPSVGVTGPNAPSVVLWTEIAGMFLGHLEFFVIIYSLLKLLEDVFSPE
jgi:hypothetical protein